MSTTQWLLLGHLASAFALVSGGVAAGILQVAAMRAARPSEVALLLRLTRPAVILVGVGGVAALGFGLALVDHLDIGSDVLWIRLAVVLWIASMILGGLGGRRARHARYLAETLSREDDAPSRELAARVSDPVSVGASFLSFILVLVILVLMVWQPT